MTALECRPATGSGARGPGRSSTLPSSTSSMSSSRSDSISRSVSGSVSGSVSVAISDDDSGSATVGSAPVALGRGRQLGHVLVEGRGVRLDRALERFVRARPLPRVTRRRALFVAVSERVAHDGVRLDETFASRVQLLDLLSQRLSPPHQITQHPLAQSLRLRHHLATLLTTLLGIGIGIDARLLQQLLGPSCASAPPPRRPRPSCSPAPGLASRRTRFACSCASRNKRATFSSAFVRMSADAVFAASITFAVSSPSMEVSRCGDRCSSSVARLVTSLICRSRRRSRSRPARSSVANAIRYFCTSSGS